VDFVQTSTGFAPAEATIEDVHLLRKYLPEEIGIKAAGLRTVDQVIEAHAAGCSRIGTDATAAILEEWQARLAAAAPDQAVGNG
jgi:deoxyribose-phosphate aldolase